MAACRKQKIGAVKFLIKRGARLDLCDISQFSALRWAATHGDVSLVRLLLHHNVSVHIDCCTPNSALEIAMSYPTKAHAKIVLWLQRKLVVERRLLLEAVRKKKEKEEIALIKKYRRRIKREAQKASAMTTTHGDASEAAVTSIDRSPFALPIVPSLKRTKVKADTTDTRGSVDRSLSISSVHGSAPTAIPLEHSHSLRDLLETQLFAPPAMMWTKVGCGAWRHVQVHHRDDRLGTLPDQGDAVVSLATNNNEPDSASTRELLKNESKWQQFMNGDTHTRQIGVPHNSTTCWQLENLDV